MDAEFWGLIMGPHGVAVGAICGCVYFARTAAQERVKHDATRDQQTAYLKQQAEHNNYVNEYIRKREAERSGGIREVN